jgi:arylsulfatase A-like enzyme/cytochrome c-type biogenesis protein CcmH/NrfG
MVDKISNLLWAGFVSSLFRRFACAVFLLSTVVAAPPDPARQTAAPPNIVLITIDTTRADRMGFLGSKRGLTPNLDALARQSTVFSRAYSQVPLTAPSHATILTGTYPQFHQVNDFGVRLTAELPYAPDILRSHGYRTAAFVGAMVLDPAMHTAPGFDRGFDTYDAGFHQALPGSDRYSTTERRGSVVVAHALEWLTRQSLTHPSKDDRPDQTRSPFFIWVHLYDPHDPYDSPEPYKTRYKRTPYDGEIAYADSVVGRLLTQLRARGLFDNSLIAVMSDHGEALGDHGEDTHGAFLYDETIHVPLVIKLPRESSAVGSETTLRRTSNGTSKQNSVEKRVDARVGLVDVLPTILEAVGIAIPSEVQGESLLPAMQSADEPSEVGRLPKKDRPMYAETDYSYNSFRWSPLRSLRSGKYLFVQAPRRELYDQSVDPNADHNLAPAADAVADTLASQLSTFRQKTSNSREAPKANLDPSMEEKLSALGYFAPGSGGTAGSKDAGADPKDKIGIMNTLHRVDLLESSLKYREAVTLLENLIAEAPDTSVAYRQLGQCYMSLQEYKKAVPVLRKAAEMRPDWTKEHLQLGVALLATGDPAGAVPELEIVIAKSPREVEARVLLANAYAKTGRTREAVTECEVVLESNPEHYGALLLEGQILLLSQQSEAALRRLQKAVALQPQAPEPHVFLADAYDQLQRKTDAARERAAAQRLRSNGIR